MRKPPAAATWMVEHLVPRDEGALAGDLLEEWSAGRGRGWYWRQVGGALAAGWGAELYRLRFAVLFALAWTLPSPVVTFYAYRSGAGLALFEQSIRLAWPWSLACETALWLALGTGFAGAGVVLFHLAGAAATGRPVLRRPWRGLLAGGAAYLLATLGVEAVAMLLPSMPVNVRAHAAAWLMGSPSVLFVHLPVFVSVVVWIAATLPAKRLRRAARG